MKKVPSHTEAFLTVEVLLAAALFSIFAMAFVGAALYGEQAAAFAGERGRAVLFAEEGFAAVQNIHDNNFSDLQDGTYGLELSDGIWTLSPSPDALGAFTRSIDISTVDAYRKDVVSTVTWQESAVRAGSVTLHGRLTDWRRSTATSTP